MPNESNLPKSSSWNAVLSLQPTKRVYRPRGQFYRPTMGVYT